MNVYSETPNIKISNPIIGTNLSPPGSPIFLQPKISQCSTNNNLSGLLIFIISISILSFIWIVLYSFNFYFTQEIENGQTTPLAGAESSKSTCFIIALVVTIMILAISFAVQSCACY
jgi:hypothetical protein